MTNAEKIQEVKNEIDNEEIYGDIFKLSFDELAGNDAARLVAKAMTELFLAGATVEHIHFCQHCLLIVFSKGNRFFELRFRNNKGIAFSSLIPINESPLAE